ncbi:hypothetical protein [Shewanella sp. GD04112]|uniref:hypothetical protein n=1 Tax=Shewanella sp. GD04112 TaxID=2975434 RepID=UPI002447A021|nr:hypothetical protein [Shewanella sp. GD04112]MDH0450888.1 hypothetical protein [Shewanella sp. GD04112]
MQPGMLSLLLGGILIVPICYFGLGMIGVGSDLLTMLSGDTLSKVIIGALSAVCAVLLTNGYLTLRDGIIA